VLSQAGRPITTGVGNIGIFAAVIGGRIPLEQRQDLRVLAHHRHIVEWRKPPVERAGAPVRAWIGDREMHGIDDMTSDIQLPHRELNMISGATRCRLLALAGGPPSGSRAGAGGVVGGYPVFSDVRGRLDLPPASAGASRCLEPAFRGSRRRVRARRPCESTPSACAVSGPI